MSEQINPLINKLRLPGETFQLPSQGIFYTNNELDVFVKNGEVEVFPMTALDEIIFSTPDKLLSGKAVVDVFSRCIPQILKPMELLTKDVDYLMICLRLVTFGQTIDVSHIHTCEDAKTHTYQVDLQKMIKKTKKIDPVTINQQYNVSLPNGQQVILKPMTYGSILNLYDIMVMQKTEDITAEESEQLAITMITSIIKSVDDITDIALISDWVKQLPLGWKKQIENAVSNISDWGIDFSISTKCKDCKSPLELTISANPVSFFFQQ